MGSYPPGTPRFERPPGEGEPVPQILPPAEVVEGGGYTVGRAPRRRSRWTAAPGTNILLGLNCAVYLLMVFTGSSPFKPSVESLYLWGADNAGAVLYGGQWWRILTAMFVHGGFLHLALNMWCLWNLGMLAEPLMGTVGVIAVYLLTGAAGNLLSTAINWYMFHTPEGAAAGLIGPVGVGASGAVFGIAGALIVLLKSQRLPLPLPELKKLRKSVIYFAVINLVIGFSIQVGTTVTGAGIGVDNMAHLGGCACGLLFAVPMVPRIGSPRGTFNLRLRAAMGMVAGLLILFGFFLTNLTR